MTFDGTINEQAKDEEIELSNILVEDAEELPFIQLAAKEEKSNRKSSLFVNKRVHRSESLFDPPQVSSLVIQKNQADFKPDSSIYLKERGILKYQIQSG